MKPTAIDSRYKVLGEIGSGATSSVYKARDLKNNTIIALKVLSKTKTSSDVVQYFRREFRLLADLRHPNLCSVYDFGILKDGRSYFTMDYIDGKDIFTATKGLAYEKLYPVIVQLCRVLEYIHSKGFIHYDIKPSNVLIARSIEQSAKGNKKHHTQSPLLHVKLLDFGLTGEQKTKDGMLIKGTFPYIAPEVIKGLTVDSRADLYSLGVLLYKICTRKSFKTGKETSFATFLQEQRECVAELPSKVVSRIPQHLEQLIIRLLNSEPAARFSRANEVIKEINKLSRKQFDLETAKTIEGYLLSSQFVGREKEMEKLQSLYAQMQHGEGKVVLITGEAGIGKSRLLKELKTLTQMKRSRTFIGYAHRDKIGPLEPFHDIFRELISYIMTSTHLFRIKKYNLPFAVLFKIFPDLCEDHVKRDLPRLVPLEPNAEKLRTFEALSELIRYAATNLGELVILLEDLHWADELSTEFLEYAGRNLENVNLLICGTYRTEEVKNNMSFKKMMNTLKHENRFAQIELKPLKIKELYSFLDSTLTPSSNSLKLSKYVMKKSGGNPFFAEEIMRTLLQTKQATIGEQIDVGALRRVSIPATIEDIVLERIKDLDSSSQKIVEVTALLLRGFEFGFMKALTELDNTELSRSLWDLKRKNVLVEEGNTYRFYHATLAEAVCKKLSSRQKKNLYSYIGKTLEKMNRRRLQTVIEDLAHYYINARDHKKGVLYGFKAAKKSHERYAHEQAIRFYKGVLTLLGNKEPNRRFDILQKLAQIEDDIGYHYHAIKYYTQALNMKTGTSEEKIKVYIKIGSIYNKTGDFNTALHIFHRGSKLIKKTQPFWLKTLLETYVKVKIARTYQQMGKYKDANKSNFDTLSFPKEYSKKREAIRLQAVIYATSGGFEQNKHIYSKADYDKASSYFKKTYILCKKIKDEFGILDAQLNLALTYNLNYDFKNAFDYYRKSIKKLEKLGDHYGILTGIYGFGNLLMAKAWYSKALYHFDRALFISNKTGNTFVAAASFFGCGMCLLKLCNYTEAINNYKRSLKIFDDGGWQSYKVFSIQHIGEVHHKQGDYNLALKYYKKALKNSRSVGQQRIVADLYGDISSLFIEIGIFSKGKIYIDNALKIATVIDAKEAEIECYKNICRMSIMMLDYVTAIDYCKKGIRITKKTGLRLQSLGFLILESEICYHEKKYLKSIKIATRAIKMARKMGTKDLHAEALLIQVKSKMKYNEVSKLEISTMLDEAKTIAEEIRCPEILWKIYFEYGKFYYAEREFSKASHYYKKSVGILRDVSSKLKNKSYERSYLNRPDRQAVFTAIEKI